MTIIRRDLATSLVATGGFAAAVLSSFALAQSTGGTKVPHPLPNTVQPKTAPVLPPKEPAIGPVTRPSAPARTQTQAKGNMPENMSHAHPRVDTSRVYFDTPGDGAIWALGASYKASFGPERTQYIPFLGSSATQTYPVAFAIQSLEIDGRSLAFTTGIPAERTGDTVVFDRGSVLETYQLSPGGMEQSFVFDTLPARGDLVIRSTVDTELAGLETADGLRFSSERGYVTYSRALAYDANGHTTPAATHLNGGSIEIRVPADFLATAALPVTVDPVVTTFGVDTSSADTFSPDVAFDATDGVYAVVWEQVFASNDHDVYFLEFDTNGNVVPASFETVDFTSDYWAHPRIAHNEVSANFMTTAAVGLSGSRIIRGRITQGGSPYTEGSQFDVSPGTAGGENFNPDIGGDPTNTPPTYYLVTWENTFASNDHDIYARLVDAAGNLQGTTPIQVDFSTADDENPSISKCDGQQPFPTQRWTIAWQRVFAANDHDIWGAQYLWDGSLVNATFQIDFTGNDDYNPQPSSLLDGASGERDYLVAYQQVGSAFDIHARIMNGVTLVDDEDVSGLEDQGFEVQDQIHPAVDSDGNAYTIAYSEQYLGSQSDYDLYVCSVAKNGSTMRVAERHVNLDFSTAHSDNPQITSTYSGGDSQHRFMAVWESTVSTSDILGGLYDAGTFASYCFPNPGDFWDSAVSCPCSNPPSTTGRGCNNSANTGGALLTSTGNASLSSDTVHFTSSGEKPTAFSLFAQGTAPVFAGAVFGQGVRCVGGSLKRLYTHSASGGVVSAPVGSDAPVHVRSAALGDAINVGAARYYFVYYRDPAVLGGCPASSTFNCTQSGSLIWYP